MLEHDEPGPAITEHVTGRDGALLVLATTAKAALDEDYAGSVSEHVLSTLRQPVLLVGPRVDVDRGLSSPNLVVAVDGSALGAVALPVIASWTRTFGGGTPTFVEVIPFVPAIAEHAGRALEAAHLREWVDRLATYGVDAGGEVIYGEEPASALTDHAEHVENAVLVVTAERWAGAGTHWRSTSRKLAFRSSRPVLVVPADMGVSQPCHGIGCPPTKTVTKTAVMARLSADGGSATRRSSRRDPAGSTRTSLRDGAPSPSGWRALGHRWASRPAGDRSRRPPR